MNKYYSEEMFCDKHDCWCDVVDITYGQNDCNGDCDNCNYVSKVW